MTRHGCCFDGCDGWEVGGGGEEGTVRQSLPKIPKTPKTSKDRSSPRCGAASPSWCRTEACWTPLFTSCAEPAASRGVRIFFPPSRRLFSGSGKRRHSALKRESEPLRAVRSAGHRTTRVPPERGRQIEAARQQPPSNVERRTTLDGAPRKRKSMPQNSLSSNEAQGSIYHLRMLSRTHA